MRHRAIHPISPMLAIGLAAGLVAQAPPSISVGANVQVSKARDKVAHYELLAEADPSHPERLIACSIVYPDDSQRGATIVYMSWDGGKSWTPTLGEKELGDTGDPACAFGNDGTPYYAVLATPQGGKNRMRFYQSGDGGRTWGRPTLVPIIDREFIAVDRGTGDRRGHIYLSGTGSSGSLDGTQRKMDLTVFHSPDTGKTFLGPIKRSAFGKRYVYGMGNGVVLSDGTFAALFGELKEYWQDDEIRGVLFPNRPGNSNAWLRVVTSDDGGETLAPAVTVDDFYMADQRFRNIIPVLAADPGSAPFKDRMYAVWADERSGRSEIRFAWSSDKGKTWAKSITVNDDRAFAEPGTGPDDYMPMLAVSRMGVVGVAWYDRREHRDNLGWSVRFSASLDGGETFSPSVRVSDAANSYGPTTSPVIGASASTSGTGEPRSGGGLVTVRMTMNGFFVNGGHTAGMAADANGTFHPVWIDNRTGLPQMWTAPVTVAGAALKHGVRELSDLDDVGSKVTLQIVRRSYDRGTGLAVIEARLKNTSKEPVNGPIKLRAITVSSDLGQVQVVGADNGLAGAGAVWDFSSLVRSGALGPADSSEVKRLTFRLLDVRPVRQEKEYKSGVLSLDARVLGKPGK